MSISDTGRPEQGEGQAAWYPNPSHLALLIISPLHPIGHKTSDQTMGALIST